jgi:hypothetical protein
MRKALVILLFVFSVLQAQSDYQFGGYFQGLQTVQTPKNSDDIQLQSTIVNRINFNFYANENFTFNLGLRNVFDYGDFTAFGTREDIGYVDLTEIWLQEDNYTVSSQLDRLNIFYANGDFEAQVGRQRVNLGVNMVWTPNDIFNSSSVLDFSYLEKRGSDAIRAQYYFGYASSVELVYKLDYSSGVTAAAILRLNNWDYDFQFIAGQMTSHSVENPFFMPKEVSRTDYVLGFGWAGNIADAGFYGEATWFIDKERFPDTTGVLVAAISGNYTFSNSVFIHGEFLYNSAGATENIYWTVSPYSYEYNAKNLSPARYSLFGEISYPVTPLTKIDLSTIFNPLDYSFFLSPSVNISLTDNLNLSVIAQLFFGDDRTEWGDFGSFYFAELKWSF